MTEWPVWVFSLNRIPVAFSATHMLIKFLTRKHYIKNYILKMLVFDFSLNTQFRNSGVARFVRNRTKIPPKLKS